MAQTASQTRQQIPVQAQKLEQRVMTGRLLSHIFPGFDASRTPMGRYNFLSIAIAAANARLREVLLADRANAVGAEWKMLLADHQSDVQFLHAMAVIYREQSRWM